MDALLRTTYRINALATFACAAALLGAGHLLAPLFAVPAVAVWGLGAFFVPFAAWIWAISRRPHLSFAKRSRRACSTEPTLSRASRFSLSSGRR
ncbi:MAG: hypothetical protein ACJ79C_03085 [Myxococcales bacterium]